MVTDQITEVIFVGLPGPTHNYGGLSSDNVASSLNRGCTSNPQLAAQQALGLVRLMRSLGITTGILPPQLRPSLPLLRQHWNGEPEELIRTAAKENPALLEKACSSSAMWVANAATATPGIDSTNGELHLTTANLQTNLHRRIEAMDTHRVLEQIFAKVPEAVVHAPLPSELPDEGDANHMRLAPHHALRGLHVFVYGTDGNVDDPRSARQSRKAFETLQQYHRIPDEQVLYIKQNPDVIKAGVFHNDVIAVSNGPVLLVHEKAYAGGHADIEKIADTYKKLHPAYQLSTIVIREEDLSVEEAIHTYFFNSQIVTKPDSSMAIIAPTEVENLYGGKAARLMQAICADKNNPIKEVHFADLRQSMSNGGGPACLRLRVPMTLAQLEAMKTQVNVIADDALLEKLNRLIETYYPAQLQPQDIAEPALYNACRALLTAMGPVLKLRLV